jgi:hypothetical protein
MLTVSAEPNGGASGQPGSGVTQVRDADAMTDRPPPSDSPALTALTADELVEVAHTAFRHTHPGRRLGAIAMLRAQLPMVERDAVEQAVAAAYTWADIGRLLAISRQAVHRRYAGVMDVHEVWRDRYQRHNRVIAFERDKAIARAEAERRLPPTAG